MNVHLSDPSGRERDGSRVSPRIGDVRVLSDQQSRAIEVSRSRLNRDQIKTGGPSLAGSDLLVGYRSYRSGR